MHHAAETGNCNQWSLVRPGWIVELPALWAGVPGRFDRGGSNVTDDMERGLTNR